MNDLDTEQKKKIKLDIVKDREEILQNFGIEPDSEVAERSLEVADSTHTPLASVIDIASDCNNLDNLKERVEDKLDIIVPKPSFFWREKKNGNESFNPKVMADYVLNFLDIIHERETEKLLVYNNGKYNYQVGETILNEVVTQLLGYQFHSSHLGQTKKYIKNTNYLREDKTNPKGIINVRNGLIDIRDNEINFQEHTPKVYSSIKLPVKYDKYADCPKFKEFIQEVTERDGTDIKTLQEMMGYTLLKNNNKYDKAFLFLGEGSNGKSVLSDVIAEMLGEKNVSAVPLDRLNNRDFTGSDLHQKLANISAENRSEKIENTTKFRRAAVGDLMRAEEKFEKSFKFRNYSTLIFSFNNLPKIKKPTEAFYRRWIPFTFDVKFTRKNDGNPDIDEDLGDKLTTDQELSGILNFALKGLIRLRENGQFTKNVSAEEMKHFWLNHSIPMNQFLAEHIQQDSSSRETKDELFERYQEFCSKENVPSDSRQKFFKVLKDKLPVKEKRPTINGNRKRVLKGIKLC